MTITTLIATLALAGIPAQTPKFPLNPKYQTPLDFGVPEAKFRATVNRIVPNVLRAVQHEPGKKAAYWRTRVFEAVDREIAKLDFKPNETLEKFLKAAASDNWIKSVVRYTFDGDQIVEAPKFSVTMSPPTIERKADIILGDADPRGVCSAFSITTAYMFQGVVMSTSFQEAGFTAGLEDFIKLGDGLSSNHSWAYVRIGDRILQSDPTFSSIDRDKKNSLTAMPYWDRTLAGWNPESSQKFLEYRWLPFGYKDRYWTMVGKEDAWTSLSFDEWKAIVTAKH